MPTTKTAEKTTATDQPGDVYAALAAFQADMPMVRKGNTAVVKTQGGGEYRYTYADLADVVDAAQPGLTRVGLAFVCLPRLTPAGGYELAGRLVHAASGTEVEGALPLFGRDAQAIGGGITYARRYLLGCLTGLVTDDDPDARGAGARTEAQVQPEAQARDLPPHVAALRDELASLAPDTQERVKAAWPSGVPGLYHLDAAQADQVRQVIAQVVAGETTQDPR